MSCSGCCDCKAPQCKLITQNQRPSNGVWNVNKLFAKQVVCTPNVCSKNGIVNVAGIKLGDSIIDLNAGLNVGDRSCYTTGLVLQVNTNQTGGTWTELSLTSDTQIFAGNNTNNCLFIGSDDIPTGFRYTPKLAEAGLSEDSTWEYWDGASWVKIMIMVSQSVKPHDTYANTPFERVSADPENVRFQDVSTSWVKNTLNGIDKYWVKVCLTAPITTIPVISDLCLLASHTHIGNDGYTEYFGTAMPHKELIFHRKLLETVNGQLPSGGDIKISMDNTWSINGVRNRFRDGQIDSLSGVFRISFGTATSSLLMLTMSWFPTTAAAGDGLLEFQYTSIKLGDNLQNGGSSVITTIAQPVPMPEVIGELTKTTLMLPIDTLNTFEMLAIRITRLGTDVLDTYTGDVVLVDLAATVEAWF